MPHVRFRCECCSCHTRDLAQPDAPCGLCRWPNGGDPEYPLNEARENVSNYGVYYRPTDVRFAPARHPILGARGEYAVDRVALRERAYFEFGLLRASGTKHAEPTARLLSLLACIENADKLYVKK